MVNLMNALTIKLRPRLNLYGLGTEPMDPFLEPLPRKPILILVKWHLF